MSEQETATPSATSFSGTPREPPPPRGRVGLVLTAGLSAVTLAAALTLTLVLIDLSRPEYYVEHLRAAGVFERLTASYVPQLAKTRLGRVYPNADAEIFDEAATVASETFTEVWFAARTVDGLVALFRHLKDEGSPLTVHLSVADRVAAAGRAINALLPESEVARAVYDDLTARAADQITRRNATLPFGLTVDRRVWLQAARIAADRVWVVHQVQRQLQHCVDYLVGNIDTLAVSIPLYERQEELVAAVRHVVKESNVQSFVHDHIVRPAIRDNVEAKTLIPKVGLTLSKEELLEAIDAVLDSAWVQQREIDIVDSVAEYMVGRRERLELVVPLAGLKSLAAEFLTQAVERKVEAYFASLPECRHSELVFSLLRRDVVSCRPRGLDLTATKVLLGIEVHDAVWDELDARIPDSWTYSESSIRSDVSARTWDLVQSGRTAMRDGITISESVLRSALRRDSEDYLERLLRITREGWTLRASDFTTDPAQTAAVGEWMTKARHGSAIVWDVWLSLWCVGILAMLVLIALCGRNVARRARCAAGVGLGVAALLFLTSALVVAGGGAAEAWLAARVEATSTGNTLQYMVGYAPAIARSMANGLAVQIAYVAAIVGVASGAGWVALRARPRLRSEPR